MTDWERQAALSLWFGMLGTVVALIGAGVIFCIYKLTEYKLTEARWR